MRKIRRLSGIAEGLSSSQIISLERNNRQLTEHNPGRSSGSLLSLEDRSSLEDQVQSLTHSLTMALEAHAATRRELQSLKEEREEWKRGNDTLSGREQKSKKRLRVSTSRRPSPLMFMLIAGLSDNSLLGSGNRKKRKSNDWDTDPLTHSLTPSAEEPVSKRGKGEEDGV